jgi:predicted ATPase
LKHAEEAISLSEQNAMNLWLHWGQFTHGWALSELGQLGEGVGEMETGIAGFRRLGGVSREQYAIALLARAYAQMGRQEKALRTLNEALLRIEGTGEKVDQAEILRIYGEVLLQESRVTDQAEQSFRTAIEIARAQEAKWWELRTTVSLARLLRDTSRPDEARTMLADIYDWFTEGFDTADLVEAKALLDKLRP